MLATLVTMMVMGKPLSAQIKVDGDGYLRFVVGQKVVYSRTATLVVSKGKIADIKGAMLLPGVLVPGKPAGIHVDLAGTIWGEYGGTDKSLGRIVLAAFGPTVKLIPSGGYLATGIKSSIGNPGEGILGVIRQLAAETSRVKVYAPSENLTRTEIDRLSELKRVGVKLEIRLKAVATIEGSAITLGDVAQFSDNDPQSQELKEVDLGLAPPQSVDRVLDRSMILAKLRAAGYDASTFKFVGTTQVTVRRASQEVPESQFIKAAKAEAEKSYGTGLEVETKSTSPAMIVPKGELELVIEGVIKSGTSINVTVAAVVDGTKINTRTVVLRSSAPSTSTLKTGQSVTIKISSGGVQVETRGTVKSINPTTGDVTVQTESGANFTGHLAKDGSIEVTI